MTSSSEFDPELLVNGPTQAPRTIILAHGAGIGMDSEFMDTFSKGLAERDIRVVRFEFPYMSVRRKTGKRRPPDREPVLRETWLRVIESLDAEGLVIGGKSMGGRLASMSAAEMEQDGRPVMGCVFLGYPFHAPGKPENVRADHLGDIKTPCLILQGDRDPFGTKDEVAGYKLSPAIRTHFLEDGEHSFIPRKKSGRTQLQNWDQAIEAMAGFIKEL